MAIQTINLTDAVGTTGREKINSNFQELDSDLGDKAGLSSNNTFTLGQNISSFSGDILTVNGTAVNNSIIRIKDDGTETALIGSLNGDNTLYLRGAGDSRLTAGGSLSAGVTVKVGGNVGIGTTSPSSKLSVSGLPTSSAGLSSGAFWRSGTDVKIVA